MEGTVMKLQYLGHACFFVESKEYKDLIIDPFLKDNPQSNCIRRIFK